MLTPQYTHERNFGCRITESLYRGLRALTLENEVLRVTFLVDKGTDILEFLHKPSDTDFMWRSPLGVRNPATFVPTVARPDGAFLDYYEGGWQECLPTGGNAVEAAGTVFGLHGEVCLMPWDYAIVQDDPDRVRVRFWVRTVRSPLLVEKTVTLNRGRGVVSFYERLTNEGAEPFDLVWGHHPAFGAPFLDPSCVIDLPGGEVQTVSLGETSRCAPGWGFTWPQVSGAQGETFDLSRIPDPRTRSHDLAFITGMREGWYALTNADRQVGFGMIWPLDVFPALWYWQVYCGALESPWYGRTYNIALEPWSAPYQTVAEAKAQDAQRTLVPGAVQEVGFHAVAYAGHRGVARIHPDGTVEGR
ncbi:MAG: aldose 1-epimerase [Caldilineaceae bacterium]|nr:aldose 1-epimerase [Caldilineaceae bacterium]